MSTKEITLEYNGYEIKLKIKKDYESAIDTIKKTLYFQDKDLENVGIFYLDEDDCENDVDEDSFDEAYGFEKWGIRKKNEEEEDKKGNGNEDNGISEEKLEEEKKKLTKKLQNEVNEEIKQKIEDLKNKFKKIVNERIKANNSKYEQKIKDLNDIIKQLIEKNKTIIEDNKTIQKNCIEKIIEYAEQKLNDQMEFLNTDFYSNIDSKLKDSNININTKNRTIEKEIQSLEKNQSEMSKVMDNCKNNFREIYKASQKNINGNQ